MSELLQIHPDDNVAVALRPMPRGTLLAGMKLLDDLPAGHKVALREIPRTRPVLKYGQPIGAATADIPAGRHVHTHNLASTLSADFQPSAIAAVAAGDSTPVERATFDGYRRADGRAATRNEIWIVNTVGCVNHASQRIAATATAQLCRAGSGVEGVFAFPHPFGCSQLGDDLQYTQRVLAGLINHPNAAAVLLLGLGCENNQMRLMLEQLDDASTRQRIRYFNAQEVTDEVEEGVRAVTELAEYANQFQREPIDASELVLGMKCGGSDGFSGITANPLVGRVADRLAALGGTVLLSEVPEMFGAEQVLLDRCVDEPTRRATIDLVNGFRDYFCRHNQPIDENPSPGNKDGGITTLAEKSLGCVQKAGRSPIRQVLGYGEAAKPQAAGIALVRAPGNDGVSSTAMTIAGAHMLLFTTGRGTPMGFPVPTIKIATNTDLATRKPQWIDFSAGAVADGTASMDELARDLFSQVLDTASGRRRTQSEISGYREIAIWKNGITL